MKKNIFQIVIVFVTVLVLSTSVMARGKRHFRWWNPFSGLWSAIEQLQEDMSNINTDIETKLAGLKVEPVAAGGSDPFLDPSGAPIVCPGCWFPKGPVNENIRARLAGAYMPGVDFYGTDLSGADLSGADLRGSIIFSTNLSDADLYDVDFSPMTLIDNNGNGETTSTFILGSNLECAKGLDAIGLETVTWKNTICPDGSKSDENDGDNKTCSGDNLVPGPDCL